MGYAVISVIHHRMDDGVSLPSKGNVGGVEPAVNPRSGVKGAGRDDDFYVAQQFLDVL